MLKGQAFSHSPPLLLNEQIRSPLLTGEYIAYPHFYSLLTVFIITCLEDKWHGRISDNSLRKKYSRFLPNITAPLKWPESIFCHDGRRSSCWELLPSVQSSIMPLCTVLKRDLMTHQLGDYLLCSALTRAVPSAWNAFLSLLCQPFQRQPKRYFQYDPFPISHGITPSSRLPQYNCYVAVQSV